MSSVHSLSEGDMIGAADVQAAARPVPRETSEWDLISGSAIHDTSGDLLSSAIATIHTKVVEIRKSRVQQSIPSDHASRVPRHHS